MEEGAERSIHRGPEATASCSQSNRQGPCRRGGTVQTTAHTPQQQWPVSHCCLLPQPFLIIMHPFTLADTCYTTCFSLPSFIATTNKASKCLKTDLLDHNSRFICLAPAYSPHLQTDSLGQLPFLDIIEGPILMQVLNEDIYADKSEHN